jgi:hypothetical protein
MLEHRVIAGVGNKSGRERFLSGGPEITFSAIATIASVKEIRVGSLQIREFLFRSIMIYTKTIPALHPIRQAAIYALKPKFLPQNGFVG